MTTANEICGRALRLIGASPIGQAPAPADAALALAALNDLLHAFKARGADLTHVTLAAADTFALGSQYVAAVVDLLADRIAPDFGTVHAHQSDVKRARQIIMAAFHVQAVQTVDAALARLPTQWTNNGTYRQ
jgi:hypothetical protein